MFGRFRLVDAPFKAFSQYKKPDIKPWVNYWHTVTTGSAAMRLYGCKNNSNDVDYIISEEDSISKELVKYLVTVK